MARGQLRRVSPSDGPSNPEPGAHLAPVPGVDGYWYELLPCGQDPALVRDQLEPLVSQLLLGERDMLKLAEELQDRLAEIDLLYSISETLGQAIGLEAAAHIIVREVSQVVGSDRASILVYDQEAGLLRPVAGWGIDVRQFQPIPVTDPDSIAARAFRERRIISNDSEGIDHATRVRASRGYRVSRGYRGTAFLSVPILYPAPRGSPRPIGVVNLTDRVGADLFSPGDRKLVAAIANQIGAALENARLVERDLAQQRLQHELELARDLHRTLLGPPQLGEAVDVAARCVPAASVGGDFYHALRLKDDAVGVMLGDVSSHGFAAALIMAMVLSAAGIHAAAHDDPDEVLRRLRASLSGELRDTEMHLSIFYGVADRVRRRLRYSNAGHPHAFLIDAAGHPERLAATTPPLGLAPDQEIGAGEAPWRPGDVLLLFSDGLADALDADDRRFGESGVLDVVSRDRTRPAAAIVEAVLAAVPQFSAAPADDQTIVVLKA